MKFAIFGAKNEAIFINRKLTAFYSDLHITKCFIDNNPLLAGSIIDGLPVISFNQFIEDYSKDIDAVIIAVARLRSLSEIAEQLRQNNIQRIGFVRPSAYSDNKKFVIDEFGNSNLILWFKEANKPIMIYLEANIVDECNLKCKGCTHFSNLFNEESHYNLEKFEKDLTQISSNCYIVKLHLLGGEPLLCGCLNNYVDIARKLLPQSDITIITNGLLVFKQPDKLYDSMRKNDIQLQISPYKPTMKIKDKISDFLMSKDILFRFGDSEENKTILEFSKILSKTYDSDCTKSMSVCPANFCRFLRDGKLYKCPVEGMLYKFFEAYNINDDLECGIDIYDVYDWNKIIEELKNPVDACRYCAEKAQLMDWQVSAQPDMHDWIVT